MYDLVFLSYHEACANEHWELLKNKFPRALRVDGVDGLVAAHKAAANVARTKYFWVVDADNLIIEPFDFSYKWPRREEQGNHVAVWRAVNNTNGLIYGYGGVKLLPRRAVLNVPDNVVDFTTSISDHFHVMCEIASTTVINATPFEAWKAGFRESTKLASQIIDRSISLDTEERLKYWTSETYDVPNAEYCLQGAQEGAKYGEENKSSPDELERINNWEWLDERFRNR